MSDNIKVDPGTLSGSPLVATRTLTVNAAPGIEVPYGILGYESAGTLVPVDTTNGLPVSLLNSSIAVTGTFWQATQPVSAASLPLPTGAATAALQTTGNTTLSTIATALAGTLTVGGTVAADQGGSWTVTANAGSGTFAVSAASLPLPSNAAKETGGNLATLAGIVTAGTANVTVGNFPATQPVSGTLTANAGSGTFTVGGTVTANAGTNLNTSALALETGGNLATLAGTVASNKVKVDLSGTGANSTAIKVDGSAVTQPVSGTFWQTTQPVSLASLPALAAGSATIGAVNQAGSWTITANAGSGTFGVSGTVTANQGGAWSVGQSGTWTVQPGNTANTTPWLVNPSDPAATTGTISAADAATSASTNSISQTYITGTPTANSSVSVTLSANPAITFQLSGTFNGTLQFERSIDGGTAFVPFSVETVSVGSSQSSLAISDNKTYVLRGNVGSMTTVRVRCSSYTSGTLTVRFQPGFADGQVVANQGPPNAAAYAWKVDGSGVTQPVSGTVTVQQNTAGNLKVDLSGTGVNSTAIKVDPSGVTSPVSLASLPALASGSNTIGYVNTIQAGDTIEIAGTTYTVSRAFANCTSSGNTTVVTGTTGKNTYVLAYSIGPVSAAVNVYWNGSTSGALSSTKYLAANSGMGRSLATFAHVATTTAGENLQLNLSGTANVGVDVLYIQR
jgi:hypothetical protein